MKEAIAIRPLSQHTASTADVRRALQNTGYAAVQDVRYAEFHEHLPNGKERHAILMWDSSEGEYRAGHVVLTLINGYWYGEFEQGDVA